MSGTTDVLDVLGVGFGPANMALAIALEEYNATALEHCRLDVAFAERRGTPAWHPDMLFEDASMQISFLKDLATFRNPQSPYTFTSFLKSVGRLVDFTNRGSMVPLRVEFAAYLRWVGAQLGSYVRTGTEVRALRPVVHDGCLVHLEADVVTDGTPSTVAARNVVVAAGLVPRLPDGIEQGPRTWHSHHHLGRIDAVPAEASDIVVVGSGQSAVEIALDAYRRFPAATIHLVSSQYGIAPSDQGPLVNQIFDPSAVDDFYDASPDVRARMDRMHRNANNGVAHPDVIADVFDTVYRDRWLGRERLRVHRMSRVTSLQEVEGPGSQGQGAQGLDLEGRGGEQAVLVRIDHDLDGSSTEVLASAAVLATGYTTFDVTTLLGPDRDLVVRDAQDRPEVDRDSRARLHVPGPAGLYLVGQSEHLHGFGTSLLSTVAVRAGEVADSILSTHLIRHPHSTLHSASHEEPSHA